MKNIFRLLMFWPRLITQMIQAMLKRMPLQIEQQTAQIRALEATLKVKEKALVEAQLELMRRKPGGFRTRQN